MVFAGELRRLHSSISNSIGMYHIATSLSFVAHFQRVVLLQVLGDTQDFFRVALVLRFMFGIRSSTKSAFDKSSTDIEA